MASFQRRQTLQKQSARKAGAGGDLPFRCENPPDSIGTAGVRQRTRSEGPEYPGWKTIPIVSAQKCCSELKTARIR